MTDWMAKDWDKTFFWRNARYLFLYFMSNVTFFGLVTCAYYACSVKRVDKVYLVEITIDYLLTRYYNDVIRTVAASTK